MSLKLMSAVITRQQTQIQSSNNSKNNNNNNNNSSAEKILNQLLECVQNCQKRYGGKKVLATEFDSCVAGLCLTLEAVLLHGLKTNNSTLKQVVNSLHLVNDNIAFWPFVEKHLTNHERERYHVLKHIWTDAGKGRAWIRSSLNERSLERYFHILLSDPELLKVHYEEWALLRDIEKSSLLPNMAAGLTSILFAININKPELNSPTNFVNSEVLKPKEEPIIEAPIPSNKNKKKNKRKVARQFIFFEDEDMLSTSVPSSSSSISSDNSSINEMQSSTTTKKPQLQEITEENKSEIKRKLSIETSGTRDKFNMEMPGTLTPVSKPDVGELTPISVEITNKNIQNEHNNDDDDDDIIEVPTDISAVITAIENKSREELDKKQEKIDSLSKENEKLKEQIKKYVSAIKMLQSNDDGDDGDDDDYENVQKTLNSLPDFKNEAKIFEKKLIQVAEMHAELMDFNGMLQQNILQKEQQIENLKSELEILRGPVPTITMSSGSVHVWIPSAFLTGSGSSAHHVYQIFLRAGNDEWNIYRRYAQFHALHSDLKKLDPIVGTFDFPPKKTIRNKDSSIVEDRRKRLQIYLRRVIGHWPELSNCNSRFLLEQHLAFFKDQQVDQQNTSSCFPTNRTTTSNSTRTNDNHYMGL